MEIPLRIHTWPDKILKKKCKEAVIFDKSIIKLLDKMYALMRKCSGVGLAGNQAGLDLQLIVIEAEDKVFRLANPKIVKKSGRINFKEGCLSFPSLQLVVRRFERVWVAAKNEYGEDIDIEAEGPLAVIFQHEIDHINGISFIDRISLPQRLRIIPKLREIAKMSNPDSSCSGAKQGSF